ncbi:MAG: amino acid ABC transporter permease [Oscillospiraceae bacterium]|nr:amino acid ABC transporter permease [Oscillospiraceae bacterium]
MDYPTTFLGWVTMLAEKYGGEFLRGTGVTLEIAILGTILGCALGFAVGLVQSITVDKHATVFSKILTRVLKAVVAVYVEVFRGTPMMVQAMVIYYGSMSVFNLDMPSLGAGVLVLSLNTGAYMAESVRGAIGGIDPGQMEGGQAIGMSYIQIMFHVIIPQALRNLIPQIGNTFVSAIKDTSVLNVISVTELYFIARTVSGTYYKFFETYCIICVIYLILTFVTSRLVRLIEKLMAGSRNYELVLEEEEA